MVVTTLRTAARGDKNDEGKACGFLFSRTRGTHSGGTSRPLEADKGGLECHVMTPFSHYSVCVSLSLSVLICLGVFPSRFCVQVTKAGRKTRRLGGGGREGLILPCC